MMNNDEQAETGQKVFFINTIGGMVTECLLSHSLFNEGLLLSF